MAVVERVYLDNKKLKPQTIQHHLARYNFASNYLPEDERGAALDIACGSGYGTDLLRRAGYRAVGIDIDRKAIAYAKKKYPKNKYITCDVVDFNFEDFFIFNLAVIFEAIEHISYSEGLQIIEKVKKNMIKSSVFMLSTPRDINGKYNKLHKSQWDYPVLKNTLGSIFRKVEILGQDWSSGEISDIDVVNNDFYLAICRI